MAELQALEAARRLARLPLLRLLAPAVRHLLAAARRARP
jgi:hypothetical protein